MNFLRYKIHLNNTKMHSLFNFLVCFKFDYIGILFYGSTYFFCYMPLEQIVPSSVRLTGSLSEISFGLVCF